MMASSLNLLLLPLIVHAHLRTDGADGPNDGPGAVKFECPLPADAQWCTLRSAGTPIELACNSFGDIVCGRGSAVERSGMGCST